MVRTEQAGLLVLVTDGTKVACDDLEVGVLPNVVDRHFEHAEVEIRNWAEGPACYQDERLFVWIPEGPPETVGRELVAW